MEGATHYFNGLLNPADPSRRVDLDVPFEVVDQGWTWRSFFNPCDYHGGRHTINKTHVDDLYRPGTFGTIAGPGRVTVRIEGTLHISYYACSTNRRTWSFEGEITVDDDEFDFDPRKWGERGFFRELVTRLINAGGHGSSFTVRFTGRREVTYTGCCPDDGRSRR